jgi:hypothetical protein
MAIEESETEGAEQDVTGIDPRFVVSLKGKSYAIWAGVLDAVTRAGVKSLVTTVVQIPTPENGHLAVVMARLEMEDGRVFADVGDCSPASTTPQLAAAALRFASTRAKGRVCRDAVNCGAELLEDQSDAAPAAARPREQPARAAAPAPARPAGANTDGTVACEEPGCGVLLTKNQVTMSQQKAKRNLCPIHLATALKATG